MTDEAAQSHLWVRSGVGMGPGAIDLGKELKKTSETVITELIVI